MSWQSRSLSTWILQMTNCGTSTAQSAKHISIDFHVFHVFSWLVGVSIHIYFSCCWLHHYHRSNLPSVCSWVIIWPNPPSMIIPYIIHISICIILYLSIYLSIYLPIYLSIYLPIYLSIYLFIYKYIYIYIYNWNISIWRFPSSHGAPVLQSLSMTSQELSCPGITWLSVPWFQHRGSQWPTSKRYRKISKIMENHGKSYLSIWK